MIMGFMDAMKGANMNFGTVDSPDFMASYLTSKGDHFMITGAQSGTYEFTKEDIKEFKVVIAGDGFIKWKMTFRDGKVAIITSGVKDPSASGSGVSMAPIERFFGDLLVADVTNVFASADTSGDPLPRKSNSAASESVNPVKEEQLVNSQQIEQALEQEKKMVNEDKSTISNPSENIKEKQPENDAKLPKKMYILPFVFQLAAIVLYIAAIVAINVFGFNTTISFSDLSFLGLLSLELCMAAGIAQFVIVLIKSILEKKRGIRPSVILIISSIASLLGAGLSFFLTISPNMLISLPFLGISIVFGVIAFSIWKKSLKQKQL